MMPEYLYIIRGLLKKLNKPYGLKDVEECFKNLSEPTKNLYSEGLKEKYKLAVEFEINNQLNVKNIANAFEKRNITFLENYMMDKGITIELISERTNLKKEIVKLIVHENIGTIDHYMQILNVLGLGIHFSNWEDLFEESTSPENPSPIYLNSITEEEYDIVKATNTTIPAFDTVGGLLVPFSLDLTKNETINLEGEIFTTSFDKYLILKLSVSPEAKKELERRYKYKPSDPFIKIDNNYMAVEDLVFYSEEGNDYGHTFVLVSFTPQENNILPEIKIEMYYNNTTYKSIINLSNVVYI